ncbi:response regulator [Candidatus Nitrospira bockiana]
MSKTRTRVPFEHLPGGTETVLVVDDDNTVRALISETLRMKGYHVLDAQFNSGALMASGRHRGPIHLMIADVMMPGVTGRELARRLESLRPDTKILYISGYPKDMLAREDILEEHALFLQKPLSPEVLLPKVRELLDSSPPDSDQEGDEFVLKVLQALVRKKKECQLSREQAAQLEALIVSYEEARLASEAEFMVAELHVQALIQDAQVPMNDVEAAVRKSEQAQTAVRIEGLKVLRAAEAVLTPEQRRHLAALYPHGRRRMGDPFPYL